jgi:hypothetical protein
MNAFGEEMSDRLLTKKLVQTVSLQWFISPYHWDRRAQSGAREAASTGFDAGQEKAPDDAEAFDR